MSNNETKELEAVRKRIEANVRRIHKNWITEEDVQKLTDSRMAMYKSRQSK